MINNAKNILLLITPFINISEENLDKLDENEMEQLAFDIKMCISKSIAVNVYGTNK